MGRVLILFGCAIGCLAQTPPPGPPAVPREGGPGVRPALSASVRLEDWALFRSAAASVLGWRVGVVSDAFRQGTFSEAAAKVDALGLANIAGVSTQKFSEEIPKNLDYKLTANELDAVRNRLRELNLRMPAYQAGVLGPDAGEPRKLF